MTSCKKAGAHLHPKSPDELTCYMCDVTFNDRCRLTTHVKMEHTGVLVNLELITLLENWRSILYKSPLEASPSSDCVTNQVQSGSCFACNFPSNTGNSPSEHIENTHACQSTILTLPCPSFGLTSSHTRRRITQERSMRMKRNISAAL